MCLATMRRQKVFKEYLDAPLVTLLFLPLFAFSQKDFFVVGEAKSYKMVFGAQLYSFYKYEVVGVQYNLLYLDSTPTKIDFVITKDPNFTIDGKNYWDIPYNKLSEEKQLSYSFIYGFFLADFGNGWFGVYGNIQPYHTLKGKEPVFPKEQKPTFFVKMPLKREKNN